MPKDPTTDTFDAELAALEKELLEDHHEHSSIEDSGVRRRTPMGRGTFEMEHTRMRLHAEEQRRKTETLERLTRMKLESQARQANEAKDAETIKRLTYMSWALGLANVLQFIAVLALLMRQDLDVNATTDGGVSVKTGGAAAEQVEQE